MCNIQHGLTNVFIREVCTSPELSTFLVNEQQLQDIERICINKLNGVALELIQLIQRIRDWPKFSYDRTCKTHTQKMFESYFTLLHNMLRHNRNIGQLKTFRTDAEVNLSQVFKTCFLNAYHLFCWIHSKDNVKRKVADLKRRSTKSYINEIFGRKVGKWS